MTSRSHVTPLESHVPEIRLVWLLLFLFTVLLAEVSTPRRADTIRPVLTGRSLETLGGGPRAGR